jgi:hypothetical protein
MGYEELPSSKKSRSSYPFWTKWASGSVEKSVLVYQPTGHPKKALIDGEIWPPIFTHESVK